MYRLTLTSGERRAIDWVGNRYAHGDELYRLLWAGCKHMLPEGADWDSEEEITFIVPESIAWSIADIADQCDNRWDCFADELAAKLSRLVGSIV